VQSWTQFFHKFSIDSIYFHLGIKDYILDTCTDFAKSSDTANPETLLWKLLSTYISNMKHVTTVLSCTNKLITEDKSQRRRKQFRSGGGTTPA
jgi:hypothetical protein